MADDPIRPAQQRVDIRFGESVTITGGTNVFGIVNEPPSPPPAGREQADAWLFGSPAAQAGSRAGAWLDPHAGVINLRRRPELDEIIRWCATHPTATARLICAPGGQGKTALAGQVCAELRDRGWLAGFVVLPPMDWRAATLAAPAPYKRAWSRVLSAAVSAAAMPSVKGVLLVVDYADGNAEFTASLLDAIAGGERCGAPVRVLLLARHTGRWWSDLVARRGGGMVDPRVWHLPPLQRSLAAPRGPTTATADAVARQCARLWHDAVQAFTAKAVDVGLLPPSRQAAKRTKERKQFATTLDLYADALVHVLEQADGTPGDASSDTDALGRLLDAHEYRQLGLALAAAAPGADLGPEPTRVLDVICLRPSVDTAEAAHALTVLPEYAALPASTIGAVVHALAGMYPGPTRSSLWSAPRPDRLTDLHLLTRAASVHTDNDWLAHTVAVCADNSPAAAGQTLRILMRALSSPQATGRYQSGAVRLRGGVCALVRAAPGAYLPALLAMDHEEQFTTVIVEAIDDPATDMQTIRTVDMILAGAPVPRHRQAAVHVSRRLVRSGTEAGADPTLYLHDLTTLSRRLAETGRRHEALEAAEQAVSLLHSVGAADDSTLAGNDMAVVQASALNNLGTRLMEHHRPDEALAAIIRAVDIRGQLSDTDRARHLPAYIAALNNLVACLLQLGRAEQAAAAASQAVAAVSARPSSGPHDSYQLAVAWGYQADAYRVMGRTDDAYAVAAQALELLIELSRQQPFAYRAAVAAAQLRVATCLTLPADDRPTIARGSRAKGVKAAVSLASQAVHTFRELSNMDSEAHRLDLVQALHALAICLSRTNSADALAAIDDALALLRAHGAQAPQLEVAACLSTKSLLLAKMRQVDAAIVTAGEAVAGYSRATAAGLHAQRDLAAAQSNLAYILYVGRRHADAVRAAQRAVDLRNLGSGQTSAITEATGLLEAADAQANLALCAVGAKEIEIARAAQTAAVDMYRMASVEHPVALARLAEAEADLNRLQVPVKSLSAHLPLRGRFRRHWPLAPVRHLLPGVGIGFWSTDLVPHLPRMRQLREDLIAWFDRMQDRRHADRDPAPGQAVTTGATAGPVASGVAPSIAAVAPTTGNTPLALLKQLVDRTRTAVRTNPVVQKLGLAPTVPGETVSATTQHLPTLAAVATATVFAVVALLGGPENLVAAPDSSPSPAGGSAPPPAAAIGPSETPDPSDAQPPSGPTHSGTVGPSPSTTPAAPQLPPPPGTFPINLDMRELSYGYFGLTGISSIIPTAAIRTVSLRPGRHQLFAGASPYYFTVNADGTVTTDQSVPFLTVSDRNTVVGHGLPVNLDMRDLTYGVFGFMGISSIMPTIAVRTVTVFPGRHQIFARFSGFSFTLHTDGTVSTDQSLPFLTVDGRNTVVGHGLPLKLDMRGLSYPRFGFPGISSIMPAGEVQTVRVFPGRQQVATGFNTYDFTLRTDGTVETNPALPFLTGEANTLVGHGYEVTIDATALPTNVFQLTLIASNRDCRTPHRFRLTPGRHQITSSAASFDFTVRPGGTITYDPSLHYLSGDGTTVLSVTDPGG